MHSPSPSKAPRTLVGARAMLSRAEAQSEALAIPYGRLMAQHGGLRRAYLAYLYSSPATRAETECELRQIEATIGRGVTLRRELSTRASAHVTWCRAHLEALSAQQAALCDAS